jgi:hypothetical protein
MKWLLHNWCGRLYLVIQIACLAITVSISVKFTRGDYVREEIDIQQTIAFYDDGSNGRNGNLPPPDVQEKIRKAVEWDKAKHNKLRQEKTIQYLWPNLVIPFLWGVGLFVAKGFPTQRSPK